MLSLPFMSPSLRGRGLKSSATGQREKGMSVALFTRAWIEISGTLVKKRLKMVALFTRAWIEM